SVPRPGARPESAAAVARRADQRPGHRPPAGGAGAGGPAAARSRADGARHDARTLHRRRVRRPAGVARRRAGGGGRAAAGGAHRGAARAALPGPGSGAPWGARAAGRPGAVRGARVLTGADPGALASPCSPRSDHVGAPNRVGVPPSASSITVKNAPCGSSITATRPCGMSVGAMTTLPPSCMARAAVASQSLTAKYTIQCGGRFGAQWLPPPIGIIPATDVPFTSHSVYVTEPYPVALTPQPNTAGYKCCAFSGTSVPSSLPQSAPAALTRPAPVIFRGCQTAIGAPEGSRNTAIRPWSCTSNGGTTTVPPAAAARRAASSASSVVTYVDQAGRRPSPKSGPAPATVRPSLLKVT